MSESAINDCLAEQAEWAKASGVPWWREWQARIKGDDHYAGLTGFLKWLKDKGKAEDARYGPDYQGPLTDLSERLEDYLLEQISLYAVCCEIFDAGVAYGRAFPEES